MMRFSNVLYAVGMVSLAAAGSMAGCGDDGGSGTTTEGAGSTGDTMNACTPTNPACNAVESDCLSIVDNRDKPTFGLRMAQLTVTRPEVLATGLVAKLVSNAVLMNYPQCNLNGGGTFSWLIEHDTAAGTLRTGGALPQTDPKAGYCFVDQMVDTFLIQPITVPVTLGDGPISADLGDLVVPIFISDDPTATPITLPLHAARFFDTTISTDRNCIGAYNAAGLDPDNLCLPDDTNKAFIDGGKLDGYITLEEADSVIVPDAGNQSLCVILSGDPTTYGTGGSPNVCARDGMGNIVLQGDWCAGTNAAASGTCADAFALGATFSASAVDITGVCP